MLVLAFLSETKFFPSPKYVSSRALDSFRREHAGTGHYRDLKL